MPQAKHASGRFMESKLGLSTTYNLSVDVKLNIGSASGFRLVKLLHFENPTKLEFGYVKHK